MLHLIDTAISLTIVVTSVVTSAILQWVRHFIFGHKVKILPQMYFKPSLINNYMLENCTGLSRVFCPPWWMGNGHAQTICPTFLPKVPMEYKREHITLADGGVLALDWAVTGAEQLDPSVPIVLIIPGLAGDASGYTHLVKCVVDKGFRPIVFNKRGHGGCLVTTPKLQSFGDPQDFKFVVEYVSRKFPNAPLTGVGVSAGSGVISSYLGVEKENTPLVTGVGISPGYDAQKLFNEILCPLYDFLLFRGLRNIVRQNKDVLAKKFDMSHVLAASTVAEMDERLYCKIYGFNSAEEYWRENNPMRGVSDIKIPVLCISSRDDPVCPNPMIPYSVFQETDHCMLAVLDRGGHGGFVEAETLTNWADKTAIDYIASVLEYQKNEKTSS